MKITARISVNGKRIAKKFNSKQDSELWLSQIRDENSDKSLDGEIWNAIQQFSNYQASNLGRVRSINYKKSGLIKVLKPALNPDGYLQTMIQNDSGKYISTSIHRLVAIAFYGLKDGMVVNHKDGIKTNNNIENLEWCTHSYNCKHSFDIGVQLPKIGELNGMSKLTNEQVIKAREQKKNGGRFWGRNDLANELGITAKHLQKIVNSKDSSWSNV